MKRRTLALGLIALLAASAAMASWYDDYDAGVSAANKGQWSVVVQKMSAAIKGNAKEDNHARTYGAIFINYHPYYYRGVANMNLGKYEDAINDFEKTSGPGEVNLGPLEQLMQRAKAKLEAASTPEPQTQTPAPQPVRPPAPVPVPVPVPAQPAGPTMSSSVKAQVSAEINSANAALANAQKRKAGTSPSYMQAIQALADANSRLAAARSDDDLNAAMASARNAKLYADAATGPTAPVPTNTIAQTRPGVATDVVLGDTKKRVHDALEKYFAGDFEEASQKFDQLVKTDMPKNGWLWAFLGASQYSQYAFEADPAFRTKAMESFSKARQYRRWNGGLPQYFSRKIRKAFDSAS
jgi:tetratricopeptide (TPR) repeat protein